MFARKRSNYTRSTNIRYVMEYPTHVLYVTLSLTVYEKLRFCASWNSNVVGTFKIYVEGKTTVFELKNLEKANVNIEGHWHHHLMAVGRNATKRGHRLGLATDHWNSNELMHSPLLDWFGILILNTIPQTQGKNLKQKSILKLYSMKDIPLSSSSVVLTASSACWYSGCTGTHKNSHACMEPTNNHISHIA